MMHQIGRFQVALLALLLSAGLTTTTWAETGSVRVVFTKIGLVAGVGAGHGILTFRGRNYPFRVSGLSLGATIGASITKLVGRAFNIHGAHDIVGTYGSIGGGAALAGGVGGVRLQQQGSGVMLALHGVKVGVEVSVNMAGVTITMD
jgi:hypothetical protein